MSAAQHRVSAGGRQEAVGYQAACQAGRTGPPARRTLLQDGHRRDSPARQQSRLRNLPTARDLLLLFTTSFCTYFYPESVVQCSTKSAVFISKDHECHLTDGEINSRVSHRNLSSL